jgi:lantibiotic modifying enzyme
VSADVHERTAETAWRWVLDQVRHDEHGPWVPTAVTDPPADAPPSDRDGMHSGVAGLAHVLAEIRLGRDWTVEESALADAITTRLRATLAETTDTTYFDGLVGTIGALTALDARGTEDAVARLAALAGDDGWPQTTVGPPSTLPDARINDVTLGTAAVLLGALWAHRHAVAGARDLAERAADILLAEAEERPNGLDWRFVPHRFRLTAASDMPNFSHGLAGIAAALAAAGVTLGRPDLVDAARRGGDHLVTLADTSDDGFVVPRMVPFPEGSDLDPVTYTWCHGPTGTSLLFLALDRAGVDRVAGEPTLSWHRRCLHSVRTSGIPERLHPGFWDNDGRCCGTAGVGDLLLDSWHGFGHHDDLAFALHLADTLVDRALVDGDRACWRFVEHRDPEPLLPPGVGWMQGAAGIAAFLFRCARVGRAGRPTAAVARMDTWWALEGSR